MNPRRKLADLLFSHYATGSNEAAGWCQSISKWRCKALCRCICSRGAVRQWGPLSASAPPVSVVTHLLLLCLLPCQACVQTAEEFIFQLRTSAAAQDLWESSKCKAPCQDFFFLYFCTCVCCMCVCLYVGNINVVRRLWRALIAYRTFISVQLVWLLMSSVLENRWSWMVMLAVPERQKELYHTHIYNYR